MKNLYISKIINPKVELILVITFFFMIDIIKLRLGFGSIYRYTFGLADYILIILYFLLQLAVIHTVVSFVVDFIIKLFQKLFSQQKKRIPFIVRLIAFIIYTSIYIYIYYNQHLQDVCIESDKAWNVIEKRCVEQTLY